MPELPEVEAIRRRLTAQLKGRVICNAFVLKSQTVAFPKGETFAQAVRGAMVEQLRRRGKFLLLDLNNGQTMVVHLRMTGRLLVTAHEDPPPPHTHLRFALDDGRELRFVDMRRFGRFWLYDTDRADREAGMSKLGPEPFAPDVTAAYLQQRLSRRRIAVKQALLDQTIVAGIGNIYADEILYWAGIHPLARVSELTAGQWQRLAEGIPLILTKAIAFNEAAGYAEEYHSEAFGCVYGRRGEPCPRCGTPIERTVIGGRSSHFCPHCQPAGAQPGAACRNL